MSNYEDIDLEYLLLIGILLKYKLLKQKKNFNNQEIDEEYNNKENNKEENNNKENNKEENNKEDNKENDNLLNNKKFRHYLEISNNYLKKIIILIDLINNADYDKIKKGIINIDEINTKLKKDKDELLTKKQMISILNFIIIIINKFIIKIDNYL